MMKSQNMMKKITNRYSQRGRNTGMRNYFHRVEGKDIEQMKIIAENKGHSIYVEVCLQSSCKVFGNLIYRFLIGHC